MKLSCPTLIICFVSLSILGKNPFPSPPISPLSAASLPLVLTACRADGATKPCVPRKQIAWSWMRRSEWYGALADSNSARLWRSGYRFLFFITSQYCWIQNCKSIAGHGMTGGEFPGPQTPLTTKPRKRFTRKVQIDGVLAFQGHGLTSYGLYPLSYCTNKDTFEISFLWLL